MALADIIKQTSDKGYLYDGGLAGFFCCVYESVYQRELPYGIYAKYSHEPCLLPLKHIYTDISKAGKVRASIPKKISARALQMVENVFLSCLEERELALLRFLLLGYSEGSNITKQWGRAEIAPLLAAERHLWGECHLLQGFVRFSDHQGVLIAVISPKNYVLPYIAGHFINRYSSENFMIYDKTHQAALIYHDRRQDIIPVQDIEFPALAAEEEEYRELWKCFYHTVAIEERANPRCRMTHMPKRYWENMTEMHDLL
ncbi:MAG: TIGR03915 family putative DNA repair protein [Firmicutes bacterium]|nr:TIGR03915 family putative DNA repair protein [Bacillota bacterium]